MLISLRAISSLPPGCFTLPVQLHRWAPHSHQDSIPTTQMSFREPISFDEVGGVKGKSFFKKKRTWVLPSFQLVNVQFRGHAGNNTDQIALHSTPGGPENHVSWHPSLWVWLFQGEDRAGVSRGGSHCRLSRNRGLSVGFIFTFQDQ